MIPVLNKMIPLHHLFKINYFEILVPEDGCLRSVIAPLTIPYAHTGDL